jgi:hypothetical protein
MYRNRGKAEFDETTTAAGLAHNTRFVGWGCGFLDFDNDGWKDLLLVNGHAFPEVDRLNIDIRYKDRSILYRNLGGGRFADISERAGPGILERHAARGLAIGDIDNDGSLEALVNSQNEPPSLLRNSTSHAGNWVILKLEGRRSNRSAIGTRVRVSAAGRTQVDEVRGGGSYLSQPDLRLHFGLAGASKIDRIDLHWPSGIVQTVAGLRPNRVVTIEEPANEPAQALAQRADSGFGASVRAGAGGPAPQQHRANREIDENHHRRKGGKHEQRGLQIRRVLTGDRAD